MLSTSFWQKTMKLYFDQNSWLVGPRGIVEQIKMSIFFSSSCKRYIQLCLGPLNKLSTCLCAKQQKLYFDQNSWPIEPRNIFKQILIGGFFFFLDKNFTNYFLDLKICYVNFFGHRYYNGILVKITS